MTAVWISIYQNSDQVNVHDGDYVTVKYDGGKQVRIYPPAPLTSNGAWFISSDGSAYYDQELCRLAKAAPPAK
jgi:hypothetical protein